MTTGFRELKPEPKWVPPTDGRTGGWEPQFLVCEVCGAVVENDHVAIDDHDEFHRELKAAVAEARAAHLLTRRIN